MDPHVGMTFDKLLNSGGAVGREIACNNVYLLAIGKAGHNLLGGKRQKPVLFELSSAQNTSLREGVKFGT